MDDNDFIFINRNKIKLEKEYIVLYIYICEKLCLFKFCVIEICDMILNLLKEFDF